MSRRERNVGSKIKKKEHWCGWNYNNFFKFSERKIIFCFQHPRIWNFPTFFSGLRLRHVRDVIFNLSRLALSWCVTSLDGSFRVDRGQRSKSINRQIWFCRLRWDFFSCSWFTQTFHIHTQKKIVSKLLDLQKHHGEVFPFPPCAAAGFFLLLHKMQRINQHGKHLSASN